MIELLDKKLKIVECTENKLIIDYHNCFNWGFFLVSYLILSVLVYWFSETHLYSGLSLIALTILYIFIYVANMKQRRRLVFNAKKKKLILINRGSIENNRFEIRFKHIKELFITKKNVNDRHKVVMFSTYPPMVLFTVGDEIEAEKMLEELTMFMNSCLKKSKVFHSSYKDKDIAKGFSYTAIALILITLLISVVLYLTSGKNQQLLSDGEIIFLTTLLGFLPGIVLLIVQKLKSSSEESKL